MQQRSAILRVNRDFLLAALKLPLQIQFHAAQTALTEDAIDIRITHEELDETMDSYRVVPKYRDVGMVGSELVFVGWEKAT